MTGYIVNHIMILNFKVFTCLINGVIYMITSQKMGGEKYKNNIINRLFWNGKVFLKIVL